MNNHSSNKLPERKGIPLRKYENALQILSLSCPYVTNILSQALPVKNSMQTVLQPHISQASCLWKESNF
jgi:hypothetical protein